MTTILPAKHIGDAKHDADGNLTIGHGNDTVTVNLNRHGFPDESVTRPGWWEDHHVSVYIRRSSDDLTVLEIHMARHDGLAQEELDEQNRQAAIYPGGPEAYWGPCPGCGAVRSCCSC